MGHSPQEAYGPPATHQHKKYDKMCPSGHRFLQELAASKQGEHLQHATRAHLKSYIPRSRYLFAE